MRRREAGRGAAPAGWIAIRHSGGIGAPPGLTTRPCQELADDREACVKRCRTPVSTPSAERFVPTDRRSGGGVLTAKARPGVWRKNRREMSTHILWVWRAGRRPPRSQKDRGHHRFASFGAPPPSDQVRSGELLFDKPGRNRVAATTSRALTHSSCPDLIRASMPLPCRGWKRRWNGLPGQARQ